jgi:hypothetical protein
MLDPLDDRDRGGRSGAARASFSSSPPSLSE